MEKNKNIFYLLYFVYRRFKNEKYFKRFFFSLGLFDILNQIFPIIWSFSLAMLLDSVINTFSSHGDFTEVLPIFLVFIAINILRIITNETRDFFYSRKQMWLTYWEDNVFLERKSTLEPSVFENSEFMADYNTMEWNQWRIFDTVDDAFDILSESIAAIISFIALLSYSWELSLFAILSAIPAAIIVKNFGQKEWNIWNAKGEQKIKYSGYRWPFNTTEPESLQEMYVFKYGKYLLNKMKEINEDFIGKLDAMTKKRYIWSLGGSLISILFFILSIAFSLKLAFAGLLSIGALTFVISAYQQFQTNISVVFYKTSSVLGNKKLLSIFYDVQTRINNISDGNIIPIYDSNGINIRFENVWFKYPQTEKWILKNINLEIDSDEDLAIVGKNGAGKSTLIKLLLRIYYPNKGRILINGIDLKELKQDEYYKQVGVLTQVFNKFNISVEENIYMGNIYHDNEEDMKNAARMADIDSTIQKLPDGYKTFLNREIKDGAALSGGQWQKLAIARAFYRDAKLLILDEPTSAVDALSEEKIFDNIRANAKNKTTLIVSHRFATVRKAKRIIVIDDGEIVEDGNHESLIKNNGLYSLMYNTQVSKE